MLARAEESEQTCQALHQKVAELQRADTLIKAREQKDAIVASLKRSHESEVLAVEQGHR